MRRNLPSPMLELSILLAGGVVAGLCLWLTLTLRASLATGQELIRIGSLRTRYEHGNELLSRDLRKLLNGAAGLDADTVTAQREQLRHSLSKLTGMLQTPECREYGQRLSFLRDRMQADQDLCLEMHRSAMPDQARKVLDSDEYRRLEELHATKLQRLSVALHSAQQEVLVRQHELLLQLGIALGGLLIFAGLWWSLSRRSLRHWRRNLADYNRQLAGQTQSLRASNWALDQQVAERTKDLEAQNEELQSAKERAEAANQAKNNFLSSMSHELKTPLTSIQSYAGLLRDFCGDEDEEIRAEFLEVILLESQRLGRLISDVLDFSMIELGRIKLHRRWESIEKVFNHAEDTAGSLRLQKDVTLVIHGRPEVELDVDLDRIHQVISNLITNAWKFSEDGQEVRLETRLLDDGIEFALRDHGPGVPDAVKEKIFGRFQQAGNPLTDKPQGTGLGLSIAETLIVLHGGSVRCEDAPGGGARFVVQLPGAAVRSRVSGQPSG